MDVQKTTGTAPRVQPMTYPIPTRALDAWWKFDVRKTPLSGGAVHYVFRTLGSTCTNSGAPIETLMHAVLRPLETAWLIEQAWIEFDPDDDGHKRMCEYNVRGREFVEDLKRPAAFCGRTLEEAIGGLGATNPAGCFCLPETTNHKWRQMLCAIHYGLSLK